MRLLLSITLLALAGCSQDEVKPSSSRKQRLESAEVKLGKTPEARTYRYADGELRVIEAPVHDGLGFVERQRCFVWRDHEYKTSTISCGQQPDVVPATD